ncbi:hypothetical protein E2986_12456 [Frieseomelitta varia]|uniref:Uncharacterized protein n=1 Tax=Frieseomelitta varia TaxID=561572 RepID=A0A833VQ74_9HYME|nr:hypothetical protein E2986_12456 [Frieseomelitta varia]
MRSSSEEEILVFGGAYAAPTVMDRVVLVLIDRNSILRDAGCGMFSEGMLFCIAMSTLPLDLLVSDVGSFSPFSLTFSTFFIDLRKFTPVLDPHVDTPGARPLLWEESYKCERTPVHNIFREMFVPTTNIYAKRHIMKGEVKTAFSLIIDHGIMEEIRTCTEEAFRVLGTKWELNATKLDAFVALPYARSAYKAKYLDLWNKECGAMPAFFSKTMSRNYIKTNQMLLLSSMHNLIQMEKSDKYVLATIKFYNSTKCGIDIADQMARKYSVFFNILDLAGINAWVLYRETTGEKISRQEFLFQLAVELAAIYQESREEEIIPKSPTNINLNSHLRKTCKGYKTTEIYSRCKKYVCGKCTFENKLAKQMISLLLPNNFYPVISYRRVQKKKKATNYCIRFDHSWSANQLPTQRDREWQGIDIQEISVGLVLRSLNRVILLLQRCLTGKIKKKIVKSIVRQCTMVMYIAINTWDERTGYSASEKMTNQKLRKKDLQSPQVTIKNPIIKKENKNAELKLIN